MQRAHGCDPRLSLSCDGKIPVHTGRVSRRGGGGESRSGAARCAGPTDGRAGRRTGRGGRRERGSRRMRREVERVARMNQLAEMGKLAAGLAHELKNPLSTLKLNLQLLEEDLINLPGGGGGGGGGGAGNGGGTSRS